jgi:uncharacterized SAM-binding protein YcdF (DUF218 family)
LHNRRTLVIAYPCWNVASPKLSRDERLSTPVITGTRLILRLIRPMVMVVGAFTLLLAGWIALGFPTGLESWLDISGPPTRADAIVCLGGGMELPNVPLDVGWRRIFTAAQLFADDWAPLVVFTGRGSQAISEAEIYANAARWLGVPPAAIIVDPWPASTAEHAASLLGLGDPRLTRSSRLIVVTSATHARRAFLTFRKHGFTSVVVVSRYRATRAAGLAVQQPHVSAFPDFTPSTKIYSNPFTRFVERSENFYDALREAAALGYYWWQDLV